MITSKKPGAPSGRAIEARSGHDQLRLARAWATVLAERSAQAAEIGRLTRLVGVLSDCEVICHDGDGLVTSRAAHQEIIYWRERAEALAADAALQARC